jgi:hypothetical protein
MRAQLTTIPSRQKGLVLVILVVIIALAFISYIVSELSVSELQYKQDKRTASSLRKAKQALIAYAVNYPEITAANRGPGYLPCPDLNNDGVSVVINCNPAGIVNVGRLPWSTLGGEDLRDGANERLWYAVSENFDYTNSPTVNKINTQTTGTITFRDKNNNVLFDGTSLDAVVAVVIAPGDPLIRDDAVVQDRSVATGDTNAAINYLDIHVASGEDNASFQHGTLDGFIEGEIRNGAGDLIVNDQFMVITYGDIMEQVHRRVAGEIANILNDYFAACGTYPEAADFVPTSGAFRSNAFPAPPPAPGADLRYGLLPVTQAWPVGWGAVCGGNNAPVLPPWLEAENWHRLTYYAYAHDSTVADGLACGNGANPPCMTVNDNPNPPINNVQALIVFAGRDVAGVGMPDVGVGSNNESDYFEGENDNTVFDTIYDAAQVEDYVRVVAP